MRKYVHKRQFVWQKNLPYLDTRFLSNGVETQFSSRSQFEKLAGNFANQKSVVLIWNFWAYPPSCPQNDIKMWITLWKTMYFYTFLHKLKTETICELLD